MTKPERMTTFRGADEDTGAPCIFEVINPYYVEWLEHELAEANRKVQKALDENCGCIRSLD